MDQGRRRAHDVDQRLPAAADMLVTQGQVQQARPRDVPGPGRQASVPDLEILRVLEPGLVVVRLPKPTP